MGHLPQGPLNLTRMSLPCAQAVFMSSQWSGYSCRSVPQTGSPKVWQLDGHSHDADSPSGETTQRAPTWHTLSRHGSGFSASKNAAT